MIILRTKLFTKKRQEPPKDFFKIPKDWDGKYDEIIYKINRSKKYNEELATLRWFDKRRELLKIYIKDLSKGYIMTDGPHQNLRKGTVIDTHYLEDFSKRYHFRKLVFSKSLSPWDRLVYSVLKPRLLESDRKVIINIQLYSILGHAVPDEREKFYSLIKRKIIWSYLKKGKKN